MIIFIHGTMNSGKSTISELMKNAIPNTAHIEVDLLRRFISQISIDEAAPISRKNAVDVAQNLIESGFNVIIDYPLSRREAIEMIYQLKDFDNEIYFFALSPSIENVLSTRGGNLMPLNEDQKNRIIHQYSIGFNDPKIGVTIDSTNQSPGETVALILEKIDQKQVIDISKL